MTYLLYAYDPGGINCIMPIYDSLIAQHKSAVLVSHGVGYDRMHAISANTIDLSETLRSNANEDVTQSIVSLLKRWSVKVVITGTSGHDTIDRLLWQTAYSMGIKTAAVLDYWGNYALRFYTHPVNSYVNQSQQRVSFFPDIIFIMDDSAKKEAQSEGIPESRLVVSGNPYFYTLAQGCKNNVEDGDVSRTKKFVLYSEPLDILYSTREIYGFDEYDIVHIVYRALRQMYSDFELYIKPHPKQTLDEEQLPRDTKVNVVRDSTDNRLKQVDIVFGTLTTAIIEALICHRKAISVIPNKQFAFKSILERWKLPIIAMDETTIMQLIDSEFNWNEIDQRLNVLDNPMEWIIKIMEVEDVNIGD